MGKNKLEFRGNFLRIRNLAKTIGERSILQQIDFDLKNGDRSGLVGQNGAGKTTLARLILGEEKIEEGTIEFLVNAKIGYLPQAIELKHVFSELDIEFDNQFETHASRLGLDINSLDEQQADKLSGGEKLKLALSLLWQEETNFLILDEPTNHLDLKGINWLAEELKKFTGPAIIISHDRHFLDRTVNKIFELEKGKLQIYNGNYSEYRDEKERRTNLQLHQYETQQRNKERIELQLQQLQNWSEKAHNQSTKQDGYKEYFRVKAKKMDKQVKSKAKRLQQELEKNKVEKPDEEAKVSFQFESAGKRGKRIIEARKITKKYGNRTVFNNSYFYIQHGEKIGLFGENGSGKTTLINCLLEKEKLNDGEIWTSKSLKIAYLSQDVLDMPSEKSVLEFLDLSNREQIQSARTLLANLGLDASLISKPLSKLSLGERTRAKLADMLLKEYDVLILDEPTNHLDLQAREQLEKTLQEYSGTLIVVSHDFYFLNKLCKKLLIFEHEKVQRFEGTADDFINRKTKPVADKEASDEESKILIENRIASVLGEICLLDPKDAKYRELDEEYKKLIKLRGKPLF
ncbi:ABC-F type ribosomal protection protein [Neobacillus sp. PS3-34]|uniref:ribosomal protection-like ABC-F family protein n=1 Tax=Neobacillus sp. PS3-34 TaxID=3070678 RepID=UPI0027DF41FE|nr:ABC-F type ribosomal protection protein [Neobacillus sp. PS3-34]WML48185.1 ABC-F type ribosomal protection protein [Neobacillus sp. PS3-34]